MFWPSCFVFWLVFVPQKKGTCFALYFSINLNYLALQMYISGEFFICKNFCCLWIILCWLGSDFLFQEWSMGSVTVFNDKQGIILYFTWLESLWTCTQVEWIVLYISPIFLWACRIISMQDKEMLPEKPGSLGNCTTKGTMESVRGSESYFIRGPQWKTLQRIPPWLDGRQGEWGRMKKSVSRPWDLWHQKGGCSFLVPSLAAVYW